MEKLVNETLVELVSLIDYLEQQPIASNDKYDLLVNHIVNKYWDEVYGESEREKIKKAIKKANREFNKRGGKN